LKLAGNRWGNALSDTTTAAFILQPFIAPTQIQGDHGEHYFLYATNLVGCGSPSFGRASSPSSAETGCHRIDFER
jgi:hypothetical protein